MFIRDLQRDIRYILAEHWYLDQNLVVYLDMKTTRKLDFGLSTQDHLDKHHCPEPQI